MPERSSASNSPRPLQGPIDSRLRTDCHFRPLEIAYRVGDYSTFFRELLENVRTETLAAGEHAGARPLAPLDTEAYHEWTVGLFKAWAEVGDILSFYQERIANEGYLGTARENRSIREIVRLIDYLPSPGVGSSTKLAYQLLELPGSPDVVAVPERASVLSVPERKEASQIWETIGELRARAEWNAIRPRVPSVELAPSLAPSATVLDLEGTALGLEEGSPLLLEVAADGRAEPFFRRVVEVEELEADTPGAEALTRIRFDRPLAPGAPVAPGTPGATSAPDVPSEEAEALLLLGGVSTFEQELDIFGREAPEWSDLDEDVKLRYAQPLGGVVVGASGPEWKSINVGLPEGEVGSVLAGADGSLYAGTVNGVFRTADGENWRRSGTDLIGNEILCLATDGRQQIFAGTAKNGVLRSTDGEAWEVLLGEAIRESLVPLGKGRLPRSGRLPLSPVRVIVPAGDRVFAGTDHGVFAFVQQMDTWLAVNKGLPDWAAKTGRAGVIVQALIPVGERELFAGTDKGVFHTADNGRSWRSRNAGLPGYDAETGTAKVSVLSLHFNRDPRTGTRILMAGSDQGVFRSTDDGGSWESASLGLAGTDVDTGLSETPVAALVFAANPETLEARYFASTPEGLFVSANAGVYWSNVADGVVERPISALAPSPAGGLIAAVPLGGFDRERWPRFRIRDSRIDLMNAAPGIEAGDWLVVTQADAPDPADTDKEMVAIVRAAQVRLLAREDFTLEAAVTRVIPDRPLDNEEKFDLRNAKVLVGTRPLRIPTGHRPLVRPLPTQVVELDPTQRLHSFPGPRDVIIDGKPLRVKFPGIKSLRTDEGRVLVIDDEEEPQVLQAEPRSGERTRLRLRLRPGAEGELSVALAEMTWRPARDDDDSIAENVTAEWVESAADGIGPTLDLYPPLKNCYDPATVRILSNVVEATQGKTVYRDVLGSGDATQAYQRFAISAPPLTYLETASAKGWTSTLELRVNDIRWREIESLYEAEPHERVYMIRHDLEGVATVIFGDGVHGARLPTGRKNVVALYRTGLWLVGVNRGRLRVPETKPLGVDGVTNPLPAAAGARPESPDRARSRAPVALRTLGRIVSLKDYEDFCRAYPGISRARVADLDTGTGRVVHVTVATEGGGEVRSGDSFHRALTDTVNAARGGQTPLSIGSARRVSFDLRTRVRFEVDRRGADVERVVRELVLATYSYERACFEGRVTASDLVRRIGSVPGVVSVKLERFHRAGLEPATEAFLEAKPARWDEAARKIVPAELLELRQPGGLVFKMVAAR